MMNYKNEKKKKTKVKKKLFFAAIIINTIILGVLVIGGFLVVNVFFDGKIPAAAVPYIVIGFFLAGLFGTALASRWYTNQLIKEKGWFKDDKEVKKK